MWFRKWQSLRFLKSMFWEFWILSLQFSQDIDPLVVKYVGDFWDVGISQKEHFLKFGISPSAFRNFILKSSVARGEGSG